MTKELLSEETLTEETLGETIEEKLLEEIAIYACGTDTLSFVVKTFKDMLTNEFVARLGGKPPSQKGELPVVSEIVQGEVLRDIDYELLLERAKARMAELGGGDCKMHLLHLYAKEAS